MTPEALRAVIELNLAVSAAILIAVVLRKPLRAAAGACVAYGLWALTPLAAMGVLLPPRTEVVAAPAPASTPIAALPDASAPSAAPSETVMGPAAASLDLLSLAPWVWAGGALLMFGFLALRQLRFQRDIAAGKAGPAVVGFLRPRIVTPLDFEKRFSEREQTVVLAHEMVHLANNDARVNAVAALTRCLLWFNPLVHWGAHLMRIDQELACDAVVLEQHPKARKPYAEALLKAQLATRPLPIGCYWPAGDQHPLTERIAMLKKTGIGRARKVAGALVVGALSVGAGYGTWAAQPARTVMAVAPSFEVTRETIEVRVNEGSLGEMKDLAEALLRQRTAPRAELVSQPPAGSFPLSAMDPPSNLPPSLSNAEVPYRESETTTPDQRASYVALAARSQGASAGEIQVGDQKVALTGDLIFPDGSRAVLNLNGAYSGRERVWTTSTPGGALRLRASVDDGRLVVRSELARAGEITESGPVALREGAPNSVALPGGFTLNVTPNLTPTTAQEVAMLRYMNAFSKARAEAGMPGACRNAACDPPGWDYRTEMGKIRAELGLPVS